MRIPRGFAFLQGWGSARIKPTALTQRKSEQKETPFWGCEKRGLFEKSPLLNSRKNFSATGAGMLGERTQSNAPADQPRRKVPPPTCRFGGACRHGADDVVIFLPERVDSAAGACYTDTSLSGYKISMDFSGCKLIFRHTSERVYGVFCGGKDGDGENREDSCTQ